MRYNTARHASREHFVANYSTWRLYAATAFRDEGGPTACVSRARKVVLECAGGWHTLTLKNRPDSARRLHAVLGSKAICVKLHADRFRT
jgi:hypothetical protein